jgi:hypothetical protein
MQRAAIALTASVAVLVASSTAVMAADISAGDGASQVTIATPIVQPSKGACTPVPYAFSIATSVDVATAVIVDASGNLVARGSELVPGNGRDDLNVCGVNLIGRKGPYSLHLRISYVTDGEPTTAEVSSVTFRFAPRAIRCRKGTKPRKGAVRTFTSVRCPRGWTPAPR